MQLTLKTDIREQIHNLKYEKCYFCGKEEPIGTLKWFNGGDLFSSNPICHEECYIKALKEKGFNDVGYKTIDDNTIEIFSQTTGWETLKLNEISKIEIVNGVFENDVFERTILIYNKDNEHTNTFGVTKECVDFLKNKTIVIDNRNNKIVIDNKR